MIDTVDAKLAVLRVASSTLWIREVGANRGQAVEAILKFVGLEPGNPWCASWVSWVGHAVLGDDWPLPRAGGCATLGEEATYRKMLRDAPADGAIFLLWSDTKGRYNHTGFVVAKAEVGGWFTIEGNASPDGSPEGTGVFRRKRTFSVKDRFIWWWS